MVPFQNFQAQWAELGGVAAEAFDRVGRGGNYILGEEVREFERSLAQWWDRRHAIGCGNGLDAIEIGLRALGVKPGDRVLTTPLSAFATTLAIVRAGCVPVFTDVDEFGLLDLNQVEALLERQRIAFLVPVHLYGLPLDLNRLGKLQARFGLKTVEDCAQAIGAEWNGLPVGAVGQVAATSFYPTKNLGGLGDGGALLTDDATLAQSARALRDYGQSAKYVHDTLGLNSRLDEVQAAILRQAFLPQVENFTRKRTVVAERYLEAIRHPGLRLVEPHPLMRPSWHLFPVLVEGSVESFVAHLKGEGIGFSRHYPALIPRQRALESVSFEVVGSLERAEHFARAEVSLPLHPYLTSEEIDRVVNACNGWEQT